MAPQTQNDEKVLKLMKEVERRKQEIAVSERAAWATTCSLTLDGKTINLHVTNDLETLVGVVSALLVKRSFHEEAAKLLGVKSSFVYNGFTFDDWINDIKIRATKIQIAQKRKDLERYQAQLDKLLSADKKVELELDQLEKELLS